MVAPIIIGSALEIQSPKNQGKETKENNVEMLCGSRELPTGGGAKMYMPLALAIHIMKFRLESPIIAECDL